jgi:hypothetical protein
VEAARNLLPPSSTGFLLALHFDLEHGGDMFVRNVRLSPIVDPIALIFRNLTKGKRE